MIFRIRTRHETSEDSWTQVLCGTQNGIPNPRKNLLGSRDAKLSSTSAWNASWNGPLPCLVCYVAILDYLVSVSSSKSPTYKRLDPLTCKAPSSHNARGRLFSCLLVIGVCASL